MIGFGVSSYQLSVQSCVIATLNCHWQLATLWTYGTTTDTSVESLLTPHPFVALMRMK
jgi:hypothetical protein